MKGGCCSAAVHARDANQNVFDIGFRVLDEDIGVASFVEDACILYFEFRQASPASPAFREHLRVRVGGQRVLVEGFEIGVRRRGVQVVIELFDVFAVIALIVVETEQSFLED